MWNILGFIPLYFKENCVIALFKNRFFKKQLLDFYLF